MLHKRLPLPRRFRAALTKEADAELHALNGKFGLGNNYLPSVLLERLDDIAKPEAVVRAFGDFIEEYGAPAPRGD